MNTVNTIRLLLSGLPLSGLLVLSACSGDGRAFEEAVEVQELDLASLQVIPPERTIEPTFFAVGQVADFSVRGTNTSGGGVEISGIDRQWRVSDSSIATIDDNGRLVGRNASGEPIAVDLVIGGIVSESYSFTVSDAPLQTISSIDGPDTLDPCLPMEYSAVGMFSDSTRPLYEVEWSVAPTDSVRLTSGLLGEIEISGVAPGDVVLTATSAGVASEPEPITIQGTLNAITVTPLNLGLQVGGTRDMVATGDYMDGVVTIGGPPGPVDTTSDADAETETVDEVEAETTTANSVVITEGVDWAISSGVDLATVSNETGARGQLEATDAGTVTVSASCGSVTGSGTLTVSESSTTSSSSGLSFEADEINESGQLVLSLSGDANGVRVDLNDSDDGDVTSQADWTLSTTTGNDTSSTGDFIRVGNNSADRGLITPLQVGSQNVRVSYEDAVATLLVEVVP